MRKKKISTNKKPKVVKKKKISPKTKKIKKKISKKTPEEKLKELKKKASKSNIEDNQLVLRNPEIAKVDLEDYAEMVEREKHINSYYNSYKDTYNNIGKNDLNEENEEFIKNQKSLILSDKNTRNGEPSIERIKRRYNQLKQQQSRRYRDTETPAHILEEKKFICSPLSMTNLHREKPPKAWNALQRDFLGIKTELKNWKKLKLKQNFWKKLKNQRGKIYTKNIRK